jgi:hypothetical protein
MMGYLTNEVGIDGMLIAPGYQYSQIDPALTMTRAEHEKSGSSARLPGSELPVARDADHQSLTGERKLKCAGARSPAIPTGGRPCYPLTDGIFRTTTRCSTDGVGGLRPGNDRAASLRDPFRFRAVGGIRGCACGGRESII